MQQERALENFNDLSAAAKRSIIYMMKSLVDDLHMQEEIIHSDLKLVNILLCSDGKVRLCDFAGAFSIHDPNPPRPIYTTP
jgi:serine/threonine protein kinase